MKQSACSDAMMLLLTGVTVTKPTEHKYNHVKVVWMCDRHCHQACVTATATRHRHFPPSQSLPVPCTWSLLTRYCLTSVDATCRGTCTCTFLPDPPTWTSRPPCTISCSSAGATTGGSSGPSIRGCRDSRAHSSLEAHSPASCGARAQAGTSLVPVNRGFSSNT